MQKNNFGNRIIKNLIFFHHKLFSMYATLSCNKSEKSLQSNLLGYKSLKNKFKMMLGISLYTKDILKGVWDQNLALVFMACFCYFYGERALFKALWYFDQFSWSYEVTNFRFNLSDIIPANIKTNSPLVFFAWFC